MASRNRYSPEFKAKAALEPPSYFQSNIVRLIRNGERSNHNLRVG